jgi:predicted O-linked N-acetylglucosamine transferase (SPINDLY family)/glycosyltransferase involved in cell wall biosynthesis
MQNYADNAFKAAEQGTMEILELVNLVERWTDEGRTDEVPLLYQTWIDHTSSPLVYVGCFNYGVLLAANRKHAQAETMYRKALEYNPAFIQAHLNLGNCLEQLKREDEALAEWRSALKIPSITIPTNRALQLHALNNIGRLLETKRQFLEALSMLNTSFSLDSTQQDVLYHLVHLRGKICTWPVINPPKGISQSDMINGASPLAMLALSDDPALQLYSAQKFVDRKYTSKQATLAPAGGYDHDKIRIGYLSSDLSMHAVSLLTVELFEQHDREHFTVYGFCWSKEDGTAFRQRVISSMDHFIRIGDMDDKQAAETICGHEIDIIVDLQGLTSGARPEILSYRPAPIQITYLGFPGPTGLPWIDYVIADRYLIPEESAQFFTEKPLYMPNCFQVSDSKREIAIKPSRSEYSLPEDSFVFCSFNNNYKYTPEMFAAWMRILKKVPKSVLWLLADNEWAHENLIKAAKKHGIKKDRLIFAPRVAPSAYLARYQLADLFLDTFPFNGGTTANDALFMGLPLLTLSGRSFASRYAGSLLTHLELPELITTSLKEYEEKAVQLAKKNAELRGLKSRLQENKVSGPVFDIPRFVKRYESSIATVLREMESNYVEVANKTEGEKSAVAESSVSTIIATADLPLVSILIPSYKPKYFDFALRSAIAQSYGNIEIIVSDDCPDDGIKNIVDRYRSVANIWYERNPKPDGTGYHNCLNCLRLARGKYIKFLFDDDVLMPFCLQYMVDVFSTNVALNPRLVLSERWTIDSNNSYTGIYQLPLTGLNDITDTWVERNMALNRGNALGELTTAMFQREDSFGNDGLPLFDNIDGRQMRGLGDVALFINLSRLGRVLYISLPLSCFRKHGDSNSAAKDSKWFHKLFTDWEIVIEQALAYGRITLEEAIASLEALEQQNRIRETILPLLQGHSDQLAKKIGEMKLEMETRI